ncbi:uncharacterized protein DNG_05228 [Cephalotrichum gorgonifer]|uniref:Nudix hydrolase domain-containing protein n=1 Tax=Cephalotrichum gorgonifer TaxID=2041049 RepID=A0AAE8MY17_9PEZI|nr:uncharacterized protein DNG_05228 [Cephalotrichum gorgonifer]
MATKRPSEPRPSSSVILVSPKNKVLLLHRVSSTSFASAHVFPGGNLDAFHDGSIPSPDDPLRHVDGPAYRRAAVRECFEESGLLLARGRGDGEGGGLLLHVGEKERDEGRKEVHGCRVGFEEWVARMGGSPDLDGLIPFTRWITPTGAPKRFTTQMYLYFLPSTPLPLHSAFSVPTPDGGIEHTSAAFEHAATWLAMHHEQKITMFPPQYFLLTLLSRFLIGGADVEAERARFMEFLDRVPTSDDPGARDHPSSAVPWREKVISPRVLRRNEDGSVVLGLDRASREVGEAGRGGDFERVVVVDLGKKGGPWNYGVRKREEVMRGGGEKGKLLTLPGPSNHGPLGELAAPPPPAHRRTAPLLSSTRFSSSSYAIHITDLAHVWSESLDRRPIILRALKEDTSIDPSDGEENMTSFLKCLSAAFDPSDPMHRLTSISLSQSDAENTTGKDGLLVTVTCELPKELSSTPLTWRMYLKKQAPQVTATELVLPLLEGRRAQEERIEALVDVIRQKDALVSKMLDKLEASGTALEHVFPSLGVRGKGAAERRKVTRQQAEARLKGLAPFDMAAWEASVADSARREDVPTLVRSAFGGGLEYAHTSETDQYGEGLGGWWRDVVDVSSVPHDDDADERESTLGKKSAPPSSKDESQDFKSPPAKARRPEPEAAPSETGSEDEDEDEDEAPKPPPVRRIGAIGGARSRPPPKAPVPPPDDDEATASESDAAGAGSPTRDAPTRDLPPRRAEPLALRDAPRGSPPGSATASEDEAPARPSPAKRGRGVGLGRIGGVGRPREVSRSEDREDSIGSGSGGGGAGGDGGGEEKVKPVERKVLARPVKKKRKF